MALTYNIENDALYQKGLRQGEELGLKKGEEKIRQTKIAGIQKALAQAKLNPQEIAELFELSLEFVLTM
ncbi:MAG: hypothetical protein OHK0053_14300 [Microscillaceae bacterium]